MHTLLMWLLLLVKKWGWYYNQCNANTNTTMKANVEIQEKSMKKELCQKAPTCFYHQLHVKFSKMSYPATYVMSSKSSMLKAIWYVEINGLIVYL